jgi:fructose-1-phosphate kinase PfkB-like protein
LGFVVTVTANAALDRTIYLDELRIGHRQRDVSRVLATLGVPVRSVVMLVTCLGSSDQSE